MICGDSPRKAQMGLLRVPVFSLLGNVVTYTIMKWANKDIVFSPDFFFGGGQWRRSEHAHASYPGLSFRPPGFSPCKAREERKVQGLD